MIHVYDEEKGWMPARLQPPKAKAGARAKPRDLVGIAAIVTAITGAIVATAKLTKGRDAGPANAGTPDATAISVPAAPPTGAPPAPNTADAGTPPPPPTGCVVRASCESNGCAQTSLTPSARLKRSSKA